MFKSKERISEKENICNVKEKSMEFENTCKDFDLDNNIFLEAKNKIKAIRPNIK